MSLGFFFLENFHKITINKYGHFGVVKVVGCYDLSVVSMSVMGFQNKTKMGWGVGGCGELYPMRNRAEKDAVRRLTLNTSGHRGGASVHSREPKARVAEVYPYFVSKRFINYSIIIMSCRTCYNAKTVVTETLLTIIFEPKTAPFTSARHVLSYVITTTRAQIQIKWVFFLPDTLAVRLLSYSFSFSFCKLQLSSLPIVFKAYA